MTKLHVAIVDPCGLDYNGDSLKTRALGGSEASVVNMALALKHKGFEVTVYCTCNRSMPGIYDGVIYRDIERGPDTTPDILISMRSAQIFTITQNEITNRFHGPFTSNPSLKVIWAHDTFIQGEEILEELLVKEVIDEIWTLSDWHSVYLTNCYHSPKRRNFEMLKNKIWQTRNGIVPRPIINEEKDPNLFIFNSAYNKGMKVLLEKVWPEVKKRMPDAKLTVIGGYYDFGDGRVDQQHEDLRKTAEQFQGDSSVKFTGVVTGDVVARLLQKASFVLYPTAWPETFSISVLEALYYRTPVITARYGALEETALDLACYKADYSTTPNVLFTHIDEDEQVRRFVDLTMEAVNNTYLYKQKQSYCTILHDEIVTWDKVALQWKQHIYKKLDLYFPPHEYQEVTRINQKVSRIFGRRFSNPDEFVENSYGKRRRINVVTTVRNARNYIGDCIRSVAAQNYDNYRMYIIDDGSTDGTRGIIQDTINDLGWYRDKINFWYQNGDREGAVANQLKTFRYIMSQNPDYKDEIFVLLDGDDRLWNDPNLFTRLANTYADGAKFTYGSCWSLADKIPLVAQEYPQEVKEKRTFRQHQFAWKIPYTHLRTFSGHLIDDIDQSKLKEPGKDTYMLSGADVPLFYDMIERCKPHEIVAIKDMMVYYNDLNPNNDYKIHPHEQNRNADTALVAPSWTPPVLVEKVDKKERVLIAIPTAKYIEPETFQSIYNLRKPKNTHVDFQFFYGYNIDQVRNLIAHYAEQNNYDWVFWVDSDIAFPPDTLVKLLAHQKDIVAGVYRQRKPEQILEVFNHAYRPYSDVRVLTPTPFKVGAVGFGCTLTSMKVLRDLEYPQFDYHRAIAAEDTLSEDVDFCQKAKKRGYDIWVDSDILCDHHGKTTYRIK